MNDVISFFDPLTFVVDSFPYMHLYTHANGVLAYSSLVLLLLASNPGAWCRTPYL
jgi:hypothetical protein